MRATLLALMLLPTMSLAANQASETEHAGDPQDKMICKKFIRTGSLVDGYRTCKTKREWDRDRENRRSMGTADSCATRGNGINCTPE